MDRVPLQRGVVDLGHSVLDTHDGERLSLTTKERLLLAFLAAHPSEDVPRSTLLTEVWGYHPDTRTRALDTAVKGLRRKVERDPKAPDHILTVWGVGYRFEPLPAEVLAPSEGFVGRRDVLRAIRQHLAGGRSIVLTGPAGVGKSRLAQEALRTIHGSCWVPLAPLDDATQVPAAVARALPPSDRPLVDRLRRLGGPLALDNAEHLGEALDALVAGWMQQVPSLVLLLTSRVERSVADLHALAVDPLGGDARVELVRQRLQRARPQQAPSPERLHALAERLDGLPLAIELVCARASVLGVDTLLAEADRLLSSAPGPGWSSLDEAVERSMVLLDDAARAALQRCAQWRAPFRATDVVAPEHIDTLLTLERASLVHPALEPDRLTLLPTVRDVVRRSMPAPVALRRDHTERVLASAGSGERVDGRWIPDLLDRFADDTVGPAALARAGILLSRAARQTVEGVLIAADATRILDQAEKAGDPVLWADAHLAATSITSRLGKADANRAAEAVVAAAASGDALRHMRALGQQAAILRLEGRIDAAIDSVQQGLDVVATTEPCAEHAVMWAELGLLRRVRGDMHGARHALERGVALADPEGDPATAAATMHRLGTTLVMLGRFEAATVWLARARGTCLEHGLEAGAHQIATTEVFAALESGQPIDEAVFGPQDPTLVSWFHEVLNHGVRGLLAVRDDDLVAAARAAGQARSTCGERTRGPAWAYALLVDGIWRAFARDPGAADALRACLDCDDHATRVYADGYLSRLDPEHTPGPHPEVEADTLHGRFLAVARGEVGAQPPWGFHARLLWRLDRRLSPEGAGASAR